MMEYYLILGQLDYDGTLFDLSYVFIWGYEYSVASSFACCQPYGYCRERDLCNTTHQMRWGDILYIYSQCALYTRKGITVYMESTITAMF